MHENITFENLKDFFPEAFEESTAANKNTFRRHSKEIALTIGYLLGISEIQLLKRIEEDEKTIFEEIKSKLEKDSDCIAIRHLNNIRSKLMLNFKFVSRSMRNIGAADYKPLDKMELFEEDFKAIYRQEIYIITGKNDINEYIRNANQEIAKRIDKIQKYFPDWVKFKNIKTLFIMPANIPEEVKKFQFNQLDYPFQKYIYWREPIDVGYILATDSSILEIAYNNNRENFSDRNYVVDASDFIKSSINEFIERGTKIQIFVDGENTDPYMLASTINSLSDYEICKIDKIVVYSDSKHSTNAWNYFKHFSLEIPVENIKVDRIAAEKSLVDHMLVVGVSKAVYKENADSIILASSDSDFWSVIESISDVRFMVMAQREKCGHNFKNILRENNILYCYVDNFKTLENNAFFKVVFRKELEAQIAAGFNLGNAHDLFKSALTNSRAELSSAESEIIFNKYIKGLTLKVDSSGNFKIVIPE